ncbi:hypothetical protein ACLMJK_001359 [Lecanora helva]
MSENSKKGGSKPTSSKGDKAPVVQAKKPKTPRNWHLPLPIDQNSEYARVANPIYNAMSELGQRAIRTVYKRADIYKKNRPLTATEQRRITETFNFLSKEDTMPDRYGTIKFCFDVLQFGAPIFTLVILSKSYKQLNAMSTPDRGRLLELLRLNPDLDKLVSVNLTNLTYKYGVYDLHKRKVKALTPSPQPEQLDEQAEDEEESDDHDSDEDTTDSDLTDLFNSFSK